MSYEGKNILEYISSKKRGNLIHDSANIANTFNEYFSNIGPNFADEINTIEGNRCYLKYSSRQNGNTTFNLEEVNLRTAFFICLT